MKFTNLEQILEKDGIVFLTYGGFLTQPLIAGMTDALEQEAARNELSMKVSSDIFTIFIELSQNMMNYSKSKTESNGEFDSKGLIIVGMDNNKTSYYIISRNIIDANDKVKIEERLTEVESLDKDELRKLYRERRKSGRDKHSKGAGIGFVEVARRCDKVEHQFETLDSTRYYFTVKSTINLKEGN